MTIGFRREYYIPKMSLIFLVFFFLCKTLNNKRQNQNMKILSYLIRQLRPGAESWHQNTAAYVPTLMVKDLICMSFFILGVGALPHSL